MSSAPTASAGVLVVFEGIDGAGKTTQMAHLAAALRRLGLTVRAEKEPTDGPHGRRLRASARGERLPAEEELALFLADRREHVERVIAPALAGGEVVLIDRYTLSTAAYQGARGLDPRAIVAANDAFAPIPDRVVLVDVAAEVGVARVRQRDAVENAFERVEDLRRCRTIFLALAETVPNVRVFDGDVAEDDLRRVILHDVVCGALARLVPRPPAGPPTAAWERALWDARERAAP